MSLWVTDSNIRDFKEKIGRELDPQKRRILEELLAKEEEKRLQLVEDERR